MNNAKLANALTLRFAYGHDAWYAAIHLGERLGVRFGYETDAAGMWRLVVRS